jgi:hypothetical protein
MLVNIGGEPERDDYGLPPVDIEVPDDARDLARDVLAYHRELRARRRHRLLRRLRGPLTRDGMVLPLLASCLALTLLAGVTLTMFGAGRVGPAPVQRTAAPPTPAAGQASAVLPNIAAQVDGRLTLLRSLAPSVLALIPSQCRCTTALRRLNGQATAAGVPIYLVGSSGWMTEVRALAAGSGQHSAHVVEDAADVLGSAYRRAGLTAVLVDADGSISDVARDLGPGVQLAGRLRALTPGGPLGVSLGRPQQAA